MKDEEIKLEVGHPIPIFDTVKTHNLLIDRFVGWLSPDPLKIGSSVDRLQSLVHNITRI